MREYFYLYLSFSRIKLKTQIENRMSFFMLLSCKLVAFATTGIMLWVMVNRFEFIGNWNPYEILMLFSFNMMSYSFAGCFFYNFFVMLPGRIRTGELDDILTKPLNPTAYLICNSVSAGYLANFSVGLIAFIFAVAQMNIRFEIKNILMLIVLLAGGVLIQSAVLAFAYTPAFWLINSNGITRIIFDLKHFSEYPLSIYNRIIQFTLTFVLPFGFISFYPTQYLLNKADGVYFSSVFPYITILVGGITAFLGYKFWIFGLRHYESTGS